MRKHNTSEINRLANQAVAHNRRKHQQWHWDTGKTNCPWGCGDGSGMSDAALDSLERAVVAGDPK